MRAFPTLRRPLVAVGLMSGTSLDGVDAAAIETDGESVAAHLGGLTIPYSAALRGELRALLDQAAAGAPDPAHLADAVRALTQVHGEAVRLLSERLGGRHLDVIGFHGQTLLHAPERGVTWQVGDAALLSAQTGCPVVHDFRMDDVAAGGQGAPLVPLYHAALLEGQPGPLAVLNIGGVANLTFIGSDGAVRACDTGPGNALIDDWVFRHTGRPCDEGGLLAGSGTADDAILRQLMAHPYFALPTPKSLDRLSFHHALDAVRPLSLEDGAATLTAFTIEAVARTPLPERPNAWYVCGGGRLNAALIAGLAARLERPVLPVERLGWDGDLLEAECFAHLAVRSLRGLPLSLPETTGVPQPLSGARLTCAAIRPPDWWM